MLFQVYGENALYQWLGWFLVFFGLIGLNEVAAPHRVKEEVSHRYEAEGFVALQLRKAVALHPKPKEGFLHKVLGFLGVARKP